MTESDIDLFERYLADELSAQEKTALAQRLDSDPEFQTAFVGYLEESQDLRVMLTQAGSEDIIDLPSFAMASSRRRRFLPLGAAAAAGILLGVFVTSGVWAYAVPKIPEVSRIEIPLVDAGFEDTATPVPAVVPGALNRWNGDASHVVSSGDSAVEPKEGRFMMKMEPVEERPFPDRTDRGCQSPCPGRGRRGGVFCFILLRRSRGSKPDAPGAAGVHDGRRRDQRQHGEAGRSSQQRSS